MEAYCTYNTDKFLIRKPPAVQQLRSFVIILANSSEALIILSCCVAIAMLDIEVNYPVCAVSPSGDEFYTLYHANPRRDLTAPVIFYQRAAAKDAIHDLLSCRTGLLQGRPGVGKTFLMWLYALTFAEQNHSIRVVWLNDSKGLYTVLHHNRLRTYHGTVLPISPDDFLVIDALESSARLLEFHRKYIGGLEIAGHFYLIASDAVEVPSSLFEDSGSFRARLPHWTLDEYKRACYFPPFFESVKASLLARTPQQMKPINNLTMQKLTGKTPTAPSAPSAAVTESDYTVEAVRNELIDRKYYYAGHSCRYMFGGHYDVQSIVRDVMYHVQKLPFFGSVAESNSDARNHLYFDQIINDAYYCVTVPVSPFAMHAICDNMMPVLFAEKSSVVEEMASYNPLLDEQVLQIDVHKALSLGTMNQRCIQVVPMVSNTNTSEFAYALSRKSATDFSVTRKQCIVDERSVPLLDYYAHTCFFPVAKLPGAFDFVQLLSQHTPGEEEKLVLHFLQVTRAPALTLRLDLMTRFIAAFNQQRGADTVPPPIIHFEVAVITTPDRAVDYKSTAPTLIGELIGWDESRLQVFSFTRAHVLVQQEKTKKK